jgi:hypothetical protein
VKTQPQCDVEVDQALETAIAKIIALADADDEYEPTRVRALDLRFDYRVESSAIGEVFVFTIAPDGPAASYLKAETAMTKRCLWEEKDALAEKLRGDANWILVVI